MAYVAMARKWRPYSFKDMVGQEHVATTLQNAIEEGRVHHAFLFTGTRGVGKTTSARILARTLNCTGESERPCGKCPSCKDFASGSSVDILEFDGASNTGVDKIRDLIIEQVQYHPMIGKYRIFIIDEVHMITGSAFNALLKTLEEPPPHVIFIFATTEANKIPQTILSRVLRFDFKRLSQTQIIERLRFICNEEGITTDNEALSILAEKADGSMRDALTYFDQAYAFTGNNMVADAVRSVLGLPSNEIYFTLLEAIGKHDIATCFNQIEQVCSNGVEYMPLLDGFAKFLRNILYIRVSKNNSNFLNLSQELVERLSLAGASLSNGDLLRMAKMLTDTQGLLRQSTNPRLLVETCFARMAWLDHLTDLRKVLSTMQSPTTGEIKKKLTLPPVNPENKVPTNQIPSLEDLNIFDEPIEDISSLPSSDNYIFLEEPSFQYTLENISENWKSFLETFANNGETDIYYALENSKVNIDFSSEPYTCTLNIPLQKDGSRQWNATLFINSQKDQQKLIEKLESTLKAKFILDIKDFKESDSNISQPKKQLNLYEQELQYDLQLQILQEKFAPIWITSNKQITKLETNPEQTEIEDS